MKELSMHNICLKDFEPSSDFDVINYATFQSMDIWKRARFQFVVSST